MSELWLIAHKVRGEAAFDVAAKMECPECNGERFHHRDDDGIGYDCTECDGTGYWWIIPTSGHRAYPYWDMALGGLMNDDSEAVLTRTLDTVPPMPTGLLDHYPTRSAPTINAMEALLGSIAPARGGFRRRF